MVTLGHPLGQDVLDTLEKIKDNDEAVKNFGVDFGTRMCRRLLEEGGVDFPQGLGCRVWGIIRGCFGWERLWLFQTIR